MIYEIEKFNFRYENGNFGLGIDELKIGEEPITGFVGPSGSGKTTLLLILSFLLIGRWEVFKFNGLSVKIQNLKSYRKKVTYVPQHPILFSGTVESNIFYPLKLRKVKKKHAREKIKDVADMLGIKSILGNRIHEISGGEAQRVCLARALIFQPDVILLDEPTTNLDDENKLKIENCLKSIYLKTKVIMVSHDLDQVERLCRQVFRVERGKIVQNS